MRWTDAQFQQWLAKRQGVAVRSERRPRDRMNKTECRFESEVLSPLKQSGEILWYGFEALNFRLGPRVHYRPDFVVVKPDRVPEFNEVKGGFIRQDSRVKFRTAAGLYPFWDWKMWQWKAGVWRVVLEFEGSQ